MSLNWLDQLFFGVRKILADGVELLERPTINFMGVVVTDNPAENRLDVAINSPSLIELPNGARPPDPRTGFVEIGALNGKLYVVSPNDVWTATAAGSGTAATTRLLDTIVVSASSAAGAAPFTLASFPLFSNGIVELDVTILAETSDHGARSYYRHLVRAGAAGAVVSGPASLAKPIVTDDDAIGLTVTWSIVSNAVVLGVTPPGANAVKWFVHARASHFVA